MKPLYGLLAAVTLTAASGASCPQLVQQYTQPFPRALPQAATLNQVIEVVNNNSSQVQSLYTTHASVSTPGFPSLKASLAYQRQKLFRLRAETAITGPEVDVGSNEELFWLWVRRNQPPALFFCRHDRFAHSAAKRMLPIEPQWLIEGLGVVSFDPNLRHDGPTPVQGGRVEIRTSDPNQPGGTTRIAVIDDSRGLVLEEHIYDRQGQLLASSLLSKHQRDAATGITLPRHVKVICPPAKFEINLELNDLQINRMEQNPALWTMPQYGGYKEVDLGDPNLQLASPPAG